MSTAEIAISTVAELASRPKHEKVRSLDYRLLTDALGADSTQIDFERQVPEVKGRIDALQANYPTVAQLTGDAWFRAAARAFTDDEPGSDPAMAAYGGGFPAWLERFAPARPLPFLAPVARLDRAWTEAHLAPDAAPLLKLLKNQPHQK